MPKPTIFFIRFTSLKNFLLSRQQQTAGAGITNINGQLNAQFGGMSFTAGFGFFPSLFGLQFQVRYNPLKRLTSEQFHRVASCFPFIRIVILSLVIRSKFNSMLWKFRYYYATVDTKLMRLVALKIHLLHLGTWSFSELCSSSPTHP
jgi:hypothetical protein